MKPSDSEILAPYVQDVNWRDTSCLCYRQLELRKKDPEYQKQLWCYTATEQVLKKKIGISETDHKKPQRKGIARDGFFVILAIHQMAGISSVKCNASFAVFGQHFWQCEELN